MGAHIEWTHGVLRAGREFDEFGDEYEFVGTVIRRGTEGEIIGAAGHLEATVSEDVRRELASQGINTVRWDRANAVAEAPVQPSTARVVTRLRKPTLNSRRG